MPYSSAALDPHALTAAQQVLAVESRSLAMWVLNRHFRSYSKQPVVWDELRSAAIRGLIDAARRYKLDYRCESRKKQTAERRTGRLRTVLAKPVAFSTFATHTIWGTINRRVQRFKLAPGNFQSPLHASHLDAKGSGNGSFFNKLLVDHRPGPQVCAERTELAELVEDFLRFLPTRDATILQHRFGLGGAPILEFVQIGALLGITRERVKQVFCRAMERLRTTYRNRLLTMRAA